MFDASYFYAYVENDGRRAYVLLFQRNGDNKMKTMTFNFDKAVIEIRQVVEALFLCIFYRHFNKQIFSEIVDLF